jgi:hypothetical protein
MQPDNVIMGDSTGVDLPKMQPNVNDLNEEKNMAKYSKTAEFKRIVEHCDARIAFYQQFLPDGRSVDVGQIPTPEQWLIANTLIQEFNLLKGSYKLASDIVEEDAKAKNE